MQRRTLVLCSTVALIVALACAESSAPDAAAPPAPPPKPAAAPPPAAGAPKTPAVTASSGIERLGWLAGAWHGRQHGASIEEYWSAPQSKLMVGMHRDVFPEDETAFEFLRIEQRPEGVVYLASPSGDPPTVFRMAEMGDRRVVFENPDHDFPQRITYWREGEQLLVKIEGEMDSEKRSIEWRFTRFSVPVS